MIDEQLWWWTARSSGIVSWTVAALAILVGLCMPARVRTPGIGRPWLLDLHRFLGGLSLALVGVHLVALWLDSYVEFGPIELFVPFTSDYRPTAVAWGVVAFWILVVVEASSLLRHRLRRRLWWTVHLGSYLVFAFGARHAVVAGTDADHLAFRIVGLTLIALVTVGTVGRTVVARRARVRRADRRPTRIDREAEQIL